MSGAGGVIRRLAGFANLSPSGANWTARALAPPGSPASVAGVSLIVVFATSAAAGTVSL